MSIDTLIEKLQAFKDEAKYCSVKASVEVTEPDGVWFGDFDIDDVQLRADPNLSEIKHTVEIVCKGKKTNFLRARAKLAGE